MASRSCTVDVPLVGCSVNIVRRCAPTLSDLLRHRFSCDVRAFGLESDPSPVRRSALVPEKRFDTTLPSGVRISVWKADLTNFSVKAVVNPANGRLQHCGGLALALSEAGGPQIQRDSDQHIKTHGEIKTGDAVVFDAGKLNCEKIIHAVGPQLSFTANHHEVKAARPLLEKVIKSILHKVERNRLETVAIPAISSGLFNYPLSECAGTIVSTVVQFYQSSVSTRFRPKEVLLVNNDEPTVKEMERACGHILTPVKTYSQATAAKPRPETRAAKGNALEIHLGTVHVILRKGRLEEQQMDVIVNTAAANRDLDNGAVSRALLRKAGHKMQNEMTLAPPSGSVIVTNAYNLFCKQVYHTFCPERRTQGSDQILFRSVQECLWLAVTGKHRSIAFPAIGTGALGFTNREAAQVMWNAVWDFANNSQVALDVHFVIFPSDNLVFQAFEEELRSLRHKVPQTEPDQMFPGPGHSLNSKPVLHQPTLEQQESPLSPRGPSESPLSPRGPSEPLLSPRGPSEPLLSLRGPSEESVAEAEHWLQRLLFNSFNTVVISTNFIQHVGERQLKGLRAEDVRVEEFLEKGRSGLIVSGNTAEDIAVAAVEIEAMIGEIQTEFIKEEEREMKRDGTELKSTKISVSKNCPELKPFLSQIREEGLHIIKVEQVENPALEKLFQLQERRLSSSSSQDMFQLVSAQFCDVVSHIGFRPECAPPDDALLGEGLYFAADVKTALRLWAERKEAHLYLVLARVLTGRSCGGKPGLLLPPALGSDPELRFDSVTGSGVTVVFNQHQALPRFILTCKLLP